MVPVLKNSKATGLSWGVSRTKQTFQFFCIIAYFRDTVYIIHVMFFIFYVLPLIFYSRIFWIHAERMFHKPVLTRGPKNITLMVGASTNLSCEILTDLHAHIEWSRGFFFCNDSEKLNLALGKVHTKWHAVTGTTSLLSTNNTNVNNANSVFCACFFLFLTLFFFLFLFEL